MSLLSTSGLTKTYGRVTALNNLSLELPAGEPIALVGPNGAGKTTLLSLLCGFIRPSSGTATVLGEPVGSKALVGKLAALPQDANMDPRFSIARQLRFYSQLQGFSKSQANDEVARVLNIVQLADAANKKPTELSHGMRKRMSLAQSLIGSPELVLLDEPTAGIDPPNVKIIRDLIRSESSNTTFIISSHNLDELEKLCSSVIYLSEGSLLEYGAIDESASSGYLTIRLGDVPEEPFMQACRSLDGVLDIQRQAQGDYLLRITQGQQIDQAILKLLEQYDWTYRHLINGRSLEDRLYG